MKIKIIILLIALILLPVMVAYAEENKIEGDINATGTIVNVNGNNAKFREYRDLKTGLYGNVRLNYDSDNYFMRLKGSNFGYDTQNYKLNGGMWGKFKYDLHYNEIPHYYTFDAKTFYSGVGTKTLTGAPNTNISTWNTFNYQIKRREYGGGIKVDVLKPFYLDVTASREMRNGISPTSATYGATSGPIVELPAPMDYRTDTFKTEVGYAKKPFFASVSYLYSSFDNSNHILNFRDDGTTNMDAMTLPVDNKYHKIGFRGSVALPMNSKFNVNLASSSAKSSTDLFTSYLVSGAVTPITYAGGATAFNGKVETKSYAFVLTSNPVPFVNGKIFYKFYDKKNKSDEITITSPANSNELFDYHKKNLGAELGFKLPAHLYLGTAYNYFKVRREFAELPETVDNIYAADLRWNGLDFMTAKVGYERLNRDGRADEGYINSLTGDTVIERYKRRFDVGSQHRDTYKANLDIYPIDNLSLGFGYKYKRSKYDETVVGLRNDRRDEYTVDADYIAGKFAGLNAYAEYEKVKKYQFGRRFNNGVPPTTIDPNSTVKDANNYNWDVTQTDKSFSYGAGVDFYLLPKKLTLRVQYDYLNSDGNADFTIFAPAALSGGRTNDNIDTSNWDTYKKSAFMTKAIYVITKSFSVAAGYAYERYRYNDASLDNYPVSYTFIASGTNYLTGLYKDQSYNASVIFAAVTYKF